MYFHQFWGTLANAVLLNIFLLARPLNLSLKRFRFFQRNLFGCWRTKGCIPLNTVVKIIQCMKYMEYLFVEWQKEYYVKSKLGLL